MLDTQKHGRIKCPVCSKDAPSVGLCPDCGCSTDVRTNPPTFNETFDEYVLRVIGGVDKTSQTTGEPVASEMTHSDCIAQQDVITMLCEDVRNNGGEYTFKTVDGRMKDLHYRKSVSPESVGTE